MDWSSAVSDAFEQDANKMDCTEILSHGELRYHKIVPKGTITSSLVATQQKETDDAKKFDDTLSSFLRGSISISRAKTSHDESESSISVSGFLPNDKAFSERKQEFRLGTSSSVPEIWLLPRDEEGSENSLKSRMMPSTSDESLRWNTSIEETSSRAHCGDEGSTTIQRSRRRLRSLLSSSDSSIDSTSETGQVSQDSTQSLCSQSASRRRERRKENLQDMLLLSRRLEKQERRLRQNQKQALRDLEKRIGKIDDDKKQE